MTWKALRSLVMVVALAGGAWQAIGAQTGVGLSSPKVQFFDNNGDPLNGGKLYSYAAGTTTPQATYSDSGLSTPNANPVVLDSAGRATVYLNPALSYKLTLTTSADVTLWTQDNIVGPFSGVLSVTAANTRGLQISRSGADAGLSIQSSGGSGKTYGITSTTAGALTIRDDSDGTPNISLSGNDITATQTGTFSIPSGLFSVGGFGAHTVSSGGTGANSLGVRNTTSGTGNYGEVRVGNNSTATLGQILGLSSAFTPSNWNLASGVSVIGSGAGGLSLAATDASGDVRVYAGGSGTARITVADTGATTITNLTATLQGSGTAQPGFLAYNSANDGVSSAATVDFDTEVYDTASNFASDTFTAPQTGIYHLCTHVTYATTVEAGRVVSIVTSNRSYIIEQLGASDNAITMNAAGCVYADMDTSDTASVSAVSLSGGTISGGGSPYATWFSGRLVP